MKKINCPNVAKNLFILLIVSLVFAIYFQSNVYALTSDNINFQGKIVRNDTGYEGLNVVPGSPACVVDGAGNDTCDFQVAYYTASTAGTLLLTETFTNVEIGQYDGVFELSLGSGSMTTTGQCRDGTCNTPVEVISEYKDVYLELKFSPDGTNLTETFTRMPLEASPYAILSKYAEGANDAFKLSTSVSSGSQASPVTGMVYYNTTTSQLTVYDGDSWEGVKSSLWTDAGSFTYLTSASDDLVLGATTVADSTFFFDMDASSGSYLEIDDASNTNRLLTILSGGNVGIGTATPGAKLEVAGSSSTITNASGNLTISTGGLNGDILLSPHGTGRVLVSTSLGIKDTGTTPTHYTFFQGGDQSADITYTLPTADGTASGQVLTTNASGVLSWQTVATGSTAWDDILDPDSNSVIVHGAYSTDMQFDTFTAGSAFKVSSAATGLTGSLLDVSLSGSNAANTGNLFALNNTGTLNTGTSFLINHFATGTGNLAFRVNDESGDTTPFVIDGAGNVGIGTSTPRGALDVMGDEYIGSTSTTNKLVLQTSTLGQYLLTFQKNGDPVTGFTMGAGGSLSLSGGPRQLGVGTLVADTAIRMNGDGYFITGTGVGGSHSLIFKNDANVEVARFLHSGNLGLGVTTPTGVLHLKAGTATAETAPLKFTTGVNLTNAESGAMEWDGSRLYMTNTTPTRNTLAYLSDLSGFLTQGYQTIQEEGGAGLTQRSIFNFVGSGFTATDDGANTRTNITLNSKLNAYADLVSANGVLTNTSGTLSWVDLNRGDELLPTGTEGQMLYSNAGTWTAFGGMYWDDVNSRLGIGSSTPDGKLRVHDSRTAPTIYSTDWGGSYTTSNGNLIFNASDNTYGAGFPNIITIGGNSAVSIPSSSMGFSTWGSTNAVFAQSGPTGGRTAHNIAGYQQMSSQDAGNHSYNLYLYSDGGAVNTNLGGTPSHTNIMSVINKGSGTSLYNVYGIYSSVAGNTSDNAVGYSLFTTASGFGTNYAIYSAAGINYFSGNVGIGTTAPTRLLDVNGAMRLRGQMYDYNNEVGTPGQVLSTTATGVDWISLAAGHNAVTLAGENYLSIDGNQVLTASDISLTSNVTGTLGISNGGTNSTTYTSSQFLWYNGTSIVASGYDNTSFATSSHTHNWSQITNGVGIYMDYKPNNSACSGGQVLKYTTGTGWTCANDTDTNTDVLVAIDSSATAGYIGATGSDGVLRVSSPISLTDGGDYITLGITANSITGAHLVDDTLDYVDFDDTLDLDANLIQNQSTYTWTQNFTGTTTTGLTYNANSLTSGTANLISSTSTAGIASGSSYLLRLDRSGANANTAHTAYGVYSTVTNTNATSGTNIAGYFSASGATTANYGLIVASGNVGIGDTTPASLLTVGNGDLFQVNTSGDLIKIKNVTYSWPSSNGSGILTNNGSGTLSWTAGTVDTDDQRWNEILDPNANKTFTMGTYTTDFQYNTFEIGSAYKLSSTSVLGTVSSSSIMLEIAKSGANTNADHTAYGIFSTVTNTNATSGTNIAGYFSASGATTANYGLLVANGNVGIGTTTPSNKFVVNTSGYSTIELQYGGTSVVDIFSNASSNIFIGLDSGSVISTGTGNIALGDNALSANTTGLSNTAIGHYALDSNVAKQGSTALGYQAMMYANSTATAGLSYNTAIGYQALTGSGIAANNTGTQNTAVGHQSMTANTSGSSNTALGVNTLNANTTGTENVAIGQNALFTNVAKQGSVAIGYEAMRYANNTATANQSFNTAVGYQALMGSSIPANNLGDRNTVFGYQSGMNMTSGGSNTLIGVQAGYSNTTGYGNVAIGADSLSANATGTRNVVIGQAALGTNATGDHSDSVAIGYYSMGEAGGGTAGNVGLGQSTLFGVSGNYNTALGYGAGQDLTNGSYNILIGYNVQASTITSSNELNIGNTIYGNLSNDYISIGDSTPTEGMFTVGATSQFRIDTNGDLTRIKDVPYTWPSSNASGILANNGSGALSWSTLASLGGVTGTGAGTATAGQITWWNGTSTITGENDFYWDASNNRLGIGTSTPTASIDIAGASSTISNASGDITITPANNLIVDLGNVGIGDKTPASLLTVGNGDLFQVRSTGELGIGVAPSTSYSIYTTGRSYGIYAQGSSMGGRFYDTSGTSTTYVAYGNYGLYTAQNGYFGGTLGIGKTSASYALDVVGSGYFSSNLYSLGGVYTGVGDIEVGNLSTGNQYAYIDFKGDDTYTDYGLRLVRGNTGANANSELLHRGTGPLVLNAVDAGTMTFATSSTARMSISSGGTVSIASPASSYALGVGRLSGQPNIKSTSDYLIMDSNTSPAALNYFTDQDVMLAYGGGQVGIGTTSTVGSYQLLIRSVGTTSSTYSIVTRDSASSNTFWVNDAGSGWLKAAAWTYGSDIRIKENISSIEYGLNEILQLNPVHFDYITGVKNNLGFIAQDVQPIIPEAVDITDPETGMLGIKSNFIIPILVRAMQEQQNIINSLALRVDTLDGGTVRSTNSTIDSSGWYRIASLEGNNDITKVKINNSSVGSSQHLLLTVDTFQDKANINVISNFISGGYDISKARINNVDGIKYLEIYLEEVNNNNIVVNIDEQQGDWISTSITQVIDIPSISNEFAFNGVLFGISDVLQVEDTGLKVGGDLVASTTTANIGDTTSRWNDIYAKGAIRLGSGSGQEGAIRFNTESKRLELSNDGSTWVQLGDLTSQMVISPEYPGAILFADGSDNLGKMTSDAIEENATFKNYYEWISNKEVAQDYDILVRITLPNDFVSWKDDAIYLDYMTQNSVSVENNSVDVTLIGNSGVDAQSVDHISTLPGAWERMSLKSLDINDCNAPGDSCTLRISLTSSMEYFVRVGDITLNYNRSL